MRNPKVSEVWIGPVTACSCAARANNRTKPNIVYSHHQLHGYAGPLEVHLCGTYWMLNDWPQIADEIQRLHALGVVTKKTTH